MPVSSCVSSRAPSCGDTPSLIVAPLGSSWMNPSGVRADDLNSFTRTTGEESISRPSFFQSMTAEISRREIMVSAVFISFSDATHTFASITHPITTLPVYDDRCQLICTPFRVFPRAFKFSYHARNGRELQMGSGTSHSASFRSAPAPTVETAVASVSRSDRKRGTRYSSAFISRYLFFGNGRSWSGTVGSLGAP